MTKPRIFAVLFAALLVIPLAGTARADCAIGGFVTQKSKGAVQQLLAFTTNSTFFLTYFGAITTGTSGCSSSGIIQNEYEQDLFVAGTYDGLVQDMARGEGGYLESFATLMGCGSGLRSDFAAWGQSSVESLAAAPEAPRAWVAEARRDLAAHPTLSGCTRLS